MPRLRFFLTAALLLVAGGPRSTQLTPIYVEHPAIRSTPVVINLGDPAQVRVGALTLLAGWKLDSRSTQFGGWSALHVDGDRVTAIGDYGSVLRFRLTRFGHATGAQIDPLPAGCGRMDDKRQRDSESLAAVPGGWWIGYEADNRLCKVTPDFSRALALRRPAEMANWNERYGAEAILRLADGRFLAFAERPPEGATVRPLLVFAGDPADPKTPVSVKSYIPPQGYSPTDAAQLPDGRILVLNRRFGLADLFTTVLVVIDTAALDSGKPVQGTPVARLAPPTLHDNFEGLAVTVEAGRTIVWMMSDDNQMSWQATYLLKFALDPEVRPEPAPTAKTN